ncbi:MAG: hypothetical protein C5B46_04850 [Proteobacteria bacterium]|nr:MAG: hypothetical protein C5B46_04850 [Pseudomonadota bacterium]
MTSQLLALEPYVEAENKMHQAKYDFNEPTFPLSALHCGQANNANREAIWACKERPSSTHVL